ASAGGPESHSVSFAYLVYASSWLKRYYPAAFCAALLDAQPMGFYSPHSLVQDARRHGVEVRTPDLARSGAGTTLEVDAGEGRAQQPPASSRGHGFRSREDEVMSPVSGTQDLRLGSAEPIASGSGGGARPGPVPAGGGRVRPGPAPGAGAPPETGGRGGPAVRIGLAAVRGLGAALAERIVAERDAAGPYASPEDLVRRVPGLTTPQLEALATAGAFGCFGLDRRRALWVAGAVART